MQASNLNNQKDKVDLGPVQETLMLPLWARAQETVKNNPIVHDPYARQIVDTIDYDFSRIKNGHMADHQGVWAIRSYNFDLITNAFLKNNPKALVINIGAGLDTTFQRVDQKSVIWINIELPDVAAMRQKLVQEKLIPESEREITLAKSIFDFTWTDDLSCWTKNRPILFMAAGVLMYFSAKEVEILFRKLTETYPASHFIFDSMSWLPAWGANREVKKIINNNASDSSPLIKWHMKRASVLREWINTIKVIEEYPMLSKLPARNDFTIKEKLQIKIVGLFRFYNMIHLQL